jgi:hypothetical protein
LAYTLEAFVVQSATARAAAKNFSSAVAAPLSQGVSLIPLISELVAELGGTYPAGVAYPFDDLPAMLLCTTEWAEQISRSALVAFLQAEFFGGWGDQAAIGWQDGRLVFGPVQARDAINQALRWLGVVRGDEADEFDARQLGRCRSTKDWMKGTA